MIDEETGHIRTGGQSKGPRQALLRDAGTALHRVATGGPTATRPHRAQLCATRHVSIAQCSIRRSKAKECVRESGAVGSQYVHVDEGHWMNWRSSYTLGRTRFDGVHGPVCALPRAPGSQLGCRSRVLRNPVNTRPALLCAKHIHDFL